MKKELETFHYIFQISESIIFDVSYYRLGSNKKKHFSTSASLFNSRKNDFDQCGQAQESLLPKKSMAYKFYKKWDHFQIEDLTKSQYDEMLIDIEVLKSTYNFDYKNTGEGFGFSSEVELSRKTPKK